jgi:hypothetical protein
MAAPDRKNVGVFDRDAAHNEGYLYTHTSRLNCRLATGRSTDIILGTGEFQGHSVLDAAC